jgi:hypothetical protein
MEFSNVELSSLYGEMRLGISVNKKGERLPDRLPKSLFGTGFG